MTSCQSPNDPPASDNPVPAQPAPNAESASSAGAPKPESAASSSSPSTAKPFGLKAKLAAKLAELMEESSDGNLKLPLDEHWYIRWDGSCYNLIEVRMPDPNNPATKNQTTPRHLIDAYCGSSLTYALKRYTEKAVAASATQTVEALLRTLARIENTINSIAAHLTK